MKRWMWWTLLVVVVAVTAGTTLVFVNRPSVGSFVVGPKGGTFGSADRFQVQVPPNAAKDGTTLDIVVGGEGPSTDSLDGVAEQAGEPVEINVSEQMPGSSVRIPVADGEDPDRLFVAVFSEPAQAWIPLASAYDTGTRQIVAVSPHFSDIRLFRAAENWVSDLWENGPSGCERFDVCTKAYQGVRYLLAHQFQTIAGFVTGTTKLADCKPADPSWHVDVHVDGFSTCVVPDEDGGLSVRTTNASYLRYKLSAPAGSEIKPATWVGNDLTTVLMSTLYYPQHAVALPKQDNAEFTLPAPLANAAVLSGAPVVMHLAPDIGGIAFDIGMTAVSVVAAIDTAGATQASALSKLTERLASRSEAGLSTRELVDMLAGSVPGPGIEEVSDLLTNLYDCVSNAVGGITANHGDVFSQKALDAAVVVGKKCAQLVLGGRLTDVKNLANLIPDTWAGVQAAFGVLGAQLDPNRSMGEFDITVTHDSTTDWQSVSYQAVANQQPEYRCVALDD